MTNLELPWRNPHQRFTSRKGRPGLTLQPGLVAAGETLDADTLTRRLLEFFLVPRSGQAGFMVEHRSRMVLILTTSGYIPRCTKPCGRLYDATIQQFASIQPLTWLCSNAPRRVPNKWRHGLPGHQQSHGELPAWLGTGNGNLGGRNAGQGLCRKVALGRAVLAKTCSHA